MAWTIQPEFQDGTVGAVCYVCKSTLRPYTDGREGHEPAVDSGVHIEYEGWLAFCETCIVEAAALIGQMTPADAEQIRYERDRAEAELENLQRDYEIVLAALNLLRCLPASAVAPEPVVAKEAQRPLSAKK